MTEPYVPDLGLTYPEQLDGRMVKMKIVRQVVIDENYPFLEKSVKYKFLRFGLHVIVHGLMHFLSILRFGLKIEGRKNLRKHRKLLKDGAMTICNHVHRWDFPFVLMAVRYRTMYFPVWKETLNSPDAPIIRCGGGIPIPDEIGPIKFFNQAFDEVRARKKWIHVYPEGSRFDYFQPIRPFKKGTFTMAHKYKLPVVPLAISYRKPCFPFTIINWLRSLVGIQKLPMITIRVGEPIMFDETLTRKEAVQKLRKDCHAAVVRLAGIKENPYPAESD